MRPVLPLSPARTETCVASTCCPAALWNRMGKSPSASGMRTLSTSRHGLGKSSIATPVPSTITWNSEVAAAPSRSLAVTVSVVQPAAQGRTSSSEFCTRHSTTFSAEGETK